MYLNANFKIIIALLSLFCFNSAFSQEKVKDIENVVIQGKAKKYKSKKENPAYKIMQKVWGKKRNNGLDKFNSYQYKEYEKLEFDLTNIDSTFMNRKIFNKLDFVFKYADSTENNTLALPIFLNEATYENYGLNSPERKKSRIITAQKTSGFQDNQIITVTSKNLYKDINIYDNILNYFDIGFTSPVGKEGFGTYDYTLTDSLSVNGEKAYRIRFQPKRKDVLAFQGTLYISAEKFAVVRAVMKSTKKMGVNFVNGIFTELEYDNPDEDTFLPKSIKTQFDLTFLSKSKKAKGILARRSVDYSDYKMNQPIDEKVFKMKEALAQSDNLKKSDEFWESARTDSLSKSEKGVYEMLDKLEDTPKFRHLVKLYETIDSGYFNIGHAIDFGSIYSTYGHNLVEGDRLRFGARTYFSQNDPWRLQGYGAYGFKDHKFKYGAEAKVMVDKSSRLILGIGTRRDIMQLGVQLTGDDGIMSRTFASSSIFGRGTNASLSDVNQTDIFGVVEPWRNITIRLDGMVQSIKSADENLFNTYYYKDGNLRKTVNDSHVTLSLIARPGAKFSQTGVDRTEQTTLAPTIILKYIHGFEGLFNADFQYNKLQLMFYKPILIGSWGKSIVTFEAGKNFNALPLALQNVIPGNQSYSLAPNTFSQMNYYEFVADSYATLQIEHHFNGKILSYIPLIRKLQLREVAFFRSAYGTLSDDSKNINIEGWKYSAPSEHVYYEYGVGVENIGFGNLRIFRVDFNWRGNYLDRPNVSKFGIKAGFQFYF